jgi:hypothetical protein
MGTEEEPRGSIDGQNPSLGLKRKDGNLKPIGRWHHERKFKTQKVPQAYKGSMIWCLSSLETFLTTFDPTN